MKNKPFVISILLFGLAIAVVAAVNARKPPAVVQTNLENIPMEIMGYKGTEDSFAQSVYDALNADKHVYRHYRSANGHNISLYIGYYGTAKGGRTGHNPYGCLPAAGWAIIKRGTIELRPSYAPKGVEVNYNVSTSSGAHQVMLHWYQSAGDRVLATGLQQNIQRFVGRILYNRNDGAFIQVQAASDRANIPMTKEKLKDFALEVLELLPQYWPDEA